MKTLRKIGMAFLAVVLCVSFAACSDDDDSGKIDPSQLAGIWALSHIEGVEYDENGNAEQYSKDFKIDPIEEAEEDIFRFERTSSPNKYNVFYLSYDEYSKNFYENNMGTVTIEDGWLIGSDRDRWGEPERILELSSKKLVLFTEADLSLRDTQSEKSTFTKVR